ncbi:hypothetical protein G7077_03020 [Sphingomonas piscis]|uniref:Uncharacterized protein n=1 Tax=Sphingomonas piscis TaxID=2714943 RepID=A0A6G7YMR5_9SPHN|nr:hypothetical protein [Sphingomonas piscis]QIK78034.1 hypothetical protein G7077_03020 [Sphingomonas piscis]
MDDIEADVMRTVATHVANLISQLERIGLRRGLILDGLEQGVRKMREQTNREIS